MPKLGEVSVWRWNDPQQLNLTATTVHPPQIPFAVAVWVATTQTQCGQGWCVSWWAPSSLTHTIMSDELLRQRANSVPFLSDKVWDLLTTIARSPTSWKGIAERALASMGLRPNGQSLPSEPKIKVDEWWQKNRTMFRARIYDCDTAETVGLDSGVEDVGFVTRIPYARFVVQWHKILNADGTVVGD
jgi:hypothetical protein